MCSSASRNEHALRTTRTTIREKGVMNVPSQAIQQQLQREAKSVPATVIEILTKPTAFFRQMPKTGGYFAPFIFMVVVGAVGGLLLPILALLGLGQGDLIGGLAAVILMPLLIGLFGFVGAAILFVIWKILGSGESFETAYRCGAYAAAILPVTVLLQTVPYLGSVLGAAWMTYLMVVASIEVHGINAKRAWIAFGILGALVILSNLTVEIAARKMMSEMEAWGQQTGLENLENLEEMDPEEAGQAIGEFLKGIGQAAEQK